MNTYAIIKLREESILGAAVMKTYKIDSELGLVYLVVGRKYMFVTMLSNFKQPKNSKVEYLVSKCKGE